jgi:predicted DNA-binding WGR domain protein
MTLSTETPLYLERVDPSRNMERFYAIWVQPTLFGELSLIRRWGRIGRGGRDKIETYARADDAKDAQRRIEAQKRRRGYLDV